MNAARLEELKRLTEQASSADTFCMMLPADTTDVDLNWIEVARNELPRLLEERDRLLAALRWQQAFGGLLPPGLEAIAYAEAE